MAPLLDRRVNPVAGKPASLHQKDCICNPDGLALSHSSGVEIHALTQAVITRAVTGGADLHAELLFEHSTSSAMVHSLTLLDIISHPRFEHSLPCWPGEYPCLLAGKDRS